MLSVYLVLCLHIGISCCSWSEWALFWTFEVWISVCVLPVLFGFHWSSVYWRVCLLDCCFLHIDQVFVISLWCYWIFVTFKETSDDFSLLCPSLILWMFRTGCSLILLVYMPIVKDFWACPELDFGSLNLFWFSIPGNNLIIWCDFQSWDTAEYTSQWKQNLLWTKFGSLCDMSEMNLYSICRLLMKLCFW